MSHPYLSLLLTWARRDFHSRYRQSTLRSAWGVLQPLTTVAIYVVFFRGILDVSVAPLPYLSFFVAGMVIYRFIATNIGQSTTLLDSTHVFSKIYFPKEIVPLSKTLTSLVDLGVGLVALVIVALMQGVPMRTTLIALPIPLLVAVCYAAALSVFVSTVAVFVRDVAFGIPVVMQAMFFASPIGYPTSRAPHYLRWLNTVNPISVVAEAVRDTVLRHSWPHWSLVLAHGAVALLLLTLAVAHLRSIEHRIVDVA